MSAWGRRWPGDTQEPVRKATHKTWATKLSSTGAECGIRQALALCPGTPCLLPVPGSRSPRSPHALSSGPLPPQGPRSPAQGAHGACLSSAPRSPCHLSLRTTASTLKSLRFSLMPDGQPVPNGILISGME